MIVSRKTCFAAAIAVTALLSACGHNMEQRAATGAATGLIIAGPVGAAVGAAVGAVVDTAEEDGKKK
jgi:osmotically inducible lipoprotein OsmB